MNEEKSIVGEHSDHPLSYRKYILGFVLSVVLTLLAYLLVTQKAGDTNTIMAYISGLAVVQFLVQMVFFLHIGEERKPRWKQMVMWFMLGTVVIVVLGSVWIMNNLDYRMMSPEHTLEYLKSQDKM